MIQKIFYSVFLCICNDWAHIFIMTTQNRSLFLGFGATDKPCFHLRETTLQFKMLFIANFYFQRLGSYLRKRNQSLQASMDRLCRLTVSLQKQKQKSKATFLRKFLKMKTIRLAQEHWSCTTTYWNSYFYSCTYEKIYLAFHITMFLKIFWQKGYELNAKIFSACWRYKPGFY